jgi:hypothetical protein
MNQNNIQILYTNNSNSTQHIDISYSDAHLILTLSDKNEEYLANLNFDFNKDFAVSTTYCHFVLGHQYTMPKSNGTVNQMKSILFIDGNIPPPYTSTSMYILPSNFD